MALIQLIPEKDQKGEMEEKKKKIHQMFGFINAKASCVRTLMIYEAFTALVQYSS